MAAKSSEAAGRAFRVILSATDPLRPVANSNFLAEFSMGPQTQKLSENLSKLEEILTRHDEQDWVATVRKSNNEIQNQDFMGVERFLNSLGGMGSLNDVVFPDSAATEEMRNLLSSAYDLATSIKRQQ